MVELFELKDGKLIIEPSRLIVPVFKQLYDRDKSKDKTQAFKEFSYIYFLLDFKSPYAGYPNDKKEEAIKKDLFKNNKWEPDSLVTEAIIKYKYTFFSSPLINMAE